MRAHTAVLAQFSPLVAVCGLAIATPAQNRLLAPIRAAEAAGLRVGCVVRDLDTGRTWFEHHAERALIPASNQKLATVAAFLAEFGADFEFETGFEVVDGVLVVHAGGDPNWCSGTAYDARHGFAEVARRLRLDGVDALRGIRLDLGVFTGPTRPRQWPRDQYERAYCAPTGGLILDAGCLRARVSPAAGASASVEILDPPGGLPLDGQIRMTSDRKRGSVWGLRHDGEVVDLFGAYWTKGGGQTVWVAVADPTPVFRSALEHSLREAGVTLRADAPPSQVERFAIGTPVAAAIEPILAESSNVHAEQFMRVLGAAAGDGSLPGGRAALIRSLERFVGGELPSGVVVEDGSGLSRGNRMTAGFTVDLLERLAASEFATLAIDGLAQGGISGTLENRLRDVQMSGRVRAKTGTIRGVSCLSGFVCDRADKLQVFSILMNVRPGKRVPARRMRAWQDDIAIAIHDRPGGVR